MLSNRFYEQFIDYDYILIYQLDAYIFRDGLRGWCDLGYSYVGAPWFTNFMQQGEHTSLWKVGNGGFSLRKVSSFLKVLSTFSLIKPISTLVHTHFKNGRKEGVLKLPRLLKKATLGNNTHWLLNDYHRFRSEAQEDFFWGVVCSEKFDWYKVPSPQQALKFSFEMAPRRMYELNNFELPVGCHAWDLYEPEFWKQFISMESTDQGIL